MEINKVLEQNIIDLLREQEFFGHMIQQFNREFSTTSIPTAGVSYDQGNLKLIINPEFWKTLSNKEQVAVLTHECLHPMNKHFERANKYEKKEDRHLMNIAMDMAINQYIDNLPKQAQLPEEKWEKFREWEYYFEQMKKNLDKYSKSITIDDHENWEKLSDFEKEQVKQTITNAANIAKNKMSGNLPANIELLLSKLNDRSVDWKKQLRKYFGSALKEFEINTKMKRNRRYGTLFPGWRSEPKLNIYIANDVSGSVADEYIQQFYSEIDYMVTKDGVNIEVFEVDMQINQRFTYKKGQKLTVKGRGGTDYNVFFKEIEKENPDLIIYFGDGESPSVQKKPKVPVIWALLPGCNPPNNWGKKITIEIK